MIRENMYVNRLFRYVGQEVLSVLVTLELGLEGRGLRFQERAFSREKAMQRSWGANESSVGQVELTRGEREELILGRWAWPGRAGPCV